MLKYVSIIALSLILIIIGFIFILKNYLIYFKGSDSGFKNFMVYIPIVISEICFMTSAINGYTALNIYNHINHKTNISSDELELLKQSMTDRMNETATAFVVGCVCVCISLVVFRDIQKDIQKQLEKSKGTWKLDKYQ